MQYRRFGRTELQMPVFSCGGMRYQFAWQDKEPDEIPEDNQRNLEATIRKSIELGINHIETARGYGTSEMQLGRILPTLPRENLIVQTKIAPDADASNFLRDFDVSMKYLGLDHVDLLAIHGINLDEHCDWSLRKGGCIEAAQRIRAEGRARHIGFSTHGSLPTILRAVATDAFDYVNLHWYYINQTNWPAIQAATERDMGVFIISPSDKGGMLYKPSPRLVELCAPLHPMIFNNLFCLSRPEVHTLSIGAACPGDFDEHLKTLPLLDSADEMLPPIIERLERAMTDRLGAAWVRNWSEGLPTYDQTPGQVNIPVILWLRNLALAFDMIEYGRMRYNLLGNGGHWFPGLTYGSSGPHDFRECLKASPHADRIPSLLAETERLLGGAEVKRLSKSD